MSFSKYIIIDQINNNFNKLLIKCINGITYVPLDFVDPLNFEAFIILNQIIELYCKIKINNCSIDNIIITNILDNLINSKCLLFLNIPEVINSGVNIENFKNTFMVYINNQVSICLDNYNDNYNDGMQI